MFANNQEQYGYDVTCLDDVPDELRCVVCRFVLRDPVQIMTCGHRFCNDCFVNMYEPIIGIVV